MVHSDLHHFCTGQQLLMLVFCIAAHITWKTSIGRHQPIYSDEVWMQHYKRTNKHTKQNMSIAETCHRQNMVATLFVHPILQITKQIQRNKYKSQMHHTQITVPPLLIPSYPLNKTMHTYRKYIYTVRPEKSVGSRCRISSHRV